MQGVNLTKRSLDMFEYMRLCVIFAHVNVVLFLLQISLCIGVVELNATHARHFQSQPKVHSSLPLKNYDHFQHSRHTNHFTHMIDQAHHTSYYWGEGGKKGV